MSGYAPCGALGECWPLSHVKPLLRSGLLQLAACRRAPRRRPAAATHAAAPLIPRRDAHSPGLPDGTPRTPQTIDLTSCNLAENGHPPQQQQQRAQHMAAVTNHSAMAGAATTMMMQRELELEPAPSDLFALLPPSEKDMDLQDLHVVLSAQGVCDAARDIDVPNALGAVAPSEVLVEHDDGLHRQVVELAGEHAALVFPTATPLPLLILHLKQTEQFFTISLDVLDDAKQYRTITLSNHRSIVRIDGDTAELPLLCGVGWQYLPIDIEALLRDSFGTRLVETVNVTVAASCRLACAFFAAEQYADAAMPSHLRILQPSAMLGLLSR